MNDNNTRLICTTIIWTAIVCIFVFGFFKFSWRGAFAGILWVIIGLALAIAAASSTKAIWQQTSSPPRENRTEHDSQGHDA